MREASLCDKRNMLIKSFNRILNNFLLEKETLRRTFLFTTLYIYLGDRLSYPSCHHHSKFGSKTARDLGSAAQ